MEFSPRRPDVLPERFGEARAIVRDAVAAAAFPAATVEVGSPDRILWREAFGALSYEAGAPATTDQTIFDLASLTKVIATTTICMELVMNKALDLDDLLSRWLPDWRGSDRSEVTLRDLLAHSSGLTAWLPFYRDHVGRREFQRAICTLPLEYPPGTQSIYSDLGFILLGFIIEDVAGQPLARVFDDSKRKWQRPPEPLTFNPPPAWRDRTAPTEIDAWRGRVLLGEVHDENAWALGGAAGHAGLFGSARGVGQFAAAMLAALQEREPGAQPLAAAGTVRTFVAPAAVPSSSRALGWDTMLPTSSCGAHMSAAAFGHTGFTGTSLWIDPGAGVYVVFLTNRVHPSRTNDAIFRVRPALHDAIMGALG